MKLCKASLSSGLLWRTALICIVGLLAITPTFGQSALVTVQPGIINDFAGTGTKGFIGDGGPATAAELSSPLNARVDAAGNVYILDGVNYVVREVTTDGNIKTIAGKAGVACASGTCGDGGPATAATLSASLRGIFVTPAGLVYIADGGVNRVRMINAAGNILTVAGSGTAGGSGDGGVATSAMLSAPRGLAMDANGVLYIADSGNNRIRTLTGTIIAAYAGVGPTCAAKTDTIGDGCPPKQATFNVPNQLWFDPAGNLYITDSSNNRIRKISVSTGLVTTVAGAGNAGSLGDGGLATSAGLNLPQDAVTDPAGDIYIADYTNNKIRYVNGAKIISTIAGAQGGGVTTAGSTGDGGLATGALFDNPHGVGIDAATNIYVVDYLNNRVREINQTTSAMNFGPVATAASSAPQTVTLTASGTAPLTISGVTVSPGYQLVASGGTDCAAALTVQPQGTCKVSVEFAPSTLGVQNGTLLVSTNATNETLGLVTIPLTGAGSYGATGNLVVTPSTTYTGQSVTMTVMLTGNGPSAPTGTVNFYSGTTLLNTAGPVALNGNTASFTTSALATGTDYVTAVYNGDAVYTFPATSNVVAVLIYAGPPTFTVTSKTTAVTVSAGQTYVLSVSVTPVYGYLGNVSMSCLNLPANMSCVFSPTIAPVTSTSAYTELLAINTTSTPPVLGQSSGSMERGSLGAAAIGTLALLLVLPRKRRQMPLLLGLMAITALIGVSGCSSAKTPAQNVVPGTYNVTIQGTDGTLTQTETFALTVQ